MHTCQHRRPVAPLSSRRRTVAVPRRRDRARTPVQELVQEQVQEQEQEQEQEQGQEYVLGMSSSRLPWGVVMAFGLRCFGSGRR